MDGFSILPEAISVKWEEQLIAHIQSAMVNVGRDRYGIGERSRVKRYGYDYDKRVKKLDDFPEWLEPCIGIVKLVTAFPLNINSVTINEYEPGHGIAPHVDADYFGPVIAILSLGGSAIMIFRLVTSSDKQEIPPRSLATLTWDARSKWTHEIAPESVKETRYSIVFRERLLK